MFHRIFIAFSLEKVFINTVVRIAGVNYSYGNEVFLVKRTKNRLKTNKSLRHRFKQC